MALFSRHNGNKDAENEFLGRVTHSESDPLAREYGLIRNLVEERIKLGYLPMSNYSPDLSKFESGKPIFEGDRDQQAGCVHCLVVWLAVVDKNIRDSIPDKNAPYNPHLEKGWERITATRCLLFTLMSKLLMRKLPLSRETLNLMLDWCLAGDETYLDPGWYSFPAILAAVGELANHPDGLGDLTVKLCKAAELIGCHYQNTANRKIIERIHSLVGLAPEIPIAPGEAWANAALKDLATLAGPDREVWTGLLQHCKTASGGTPSTKWLKEARSHLDRLNQGQVADFLSRWLSLTDKKREQSALTMQAWISRCALEIYSDRRYELYQLLARGSQGWKDLAVIENAIIGSEEPLGYLRDFANQAEVQALFGDAAPSIDVPDSLPVFAPIEDLVIPPAHMDLLVGLAWAGGLLADPAVTRSLGMLAVSMYRKVPGIGPRAVRVGNACIVALGMIGDGDALGQLALLKVKVKFGGAQAAIDKAMTKLADKLGISREDLEEMSVPAYGLTGVGRMDLTIGDCTAELSVIDSRSTTLAWVRSDGKIQKSMPASLKQEHPEDVKELLAAKKDIERMLPAQAERLDALYLRRKSWPLDIWRERYLDHPLVGSLARRLIWNFTTDGMTIPGVWLKDVLVDHLGQPLDLDQTQTTVTLWHPLHQEPGMVLGWRRFLEEWEIVQPFKQAHREIYLLTPPEETARTYSNRFAAHLLKQHQFNALCAARSWKNKLRLMVDDEYPPATRRLPQWGLRAEFWIEGAGAEYGTDTLESGAYRYVTTDQVRFYQENDPQVSAHAGGGGYGQHQVIEPTPLASVDPLVFSEIMRDVDLFVGVASVGNDPNWLDGGHTAQQRQYWSEVSFGELGASAQTRKALLERLIPKLKIASACSFEDRFLIVQGKRHAYKIHLGSGNILIKPQDKYLCIVPAQSQVDKDGGKLFLPFEGDRTLSVIISKAFLLAADDKITDATILRQLT